MGEFVHPVYFTDDGLGGWEMGLGPTPQRSTLLITLSSGGMMGEMFPCLRGSIHLTSMMMVVSSSRLVMMLNPLCRRMIFGGIDFALSENVK